MAIFSVNTGRSTSRALPTATMLASASDEGAVNCTFDPTDTRRFPYEFLNASGSTITHGVPVAVPGFAEPVCVFNATTCATDTNCCKPTAQVESDATVFWIIALFFWGPFLLLQAWAGWKRRCARSCSPTQPRGAAYPALHASLHVVHYTELSTAARHRRRSAQLYTLGIGARSKTAAEIEAEIEADAPKPMNKLFMESGGSHYHPALKLVIGLAVVGVVVATGYRLGSWPGLGLPRPYPHSVSLLIKDVLTAPDGPVQCTSPLLRSESEP